MRKDAKKGDRRMNIRKSERTVHEVDGHLLHGCSLREMPANESESPWYANLTTTSKTGGRGRGGSRAGRHKKVLGEK